MKNEREPGNKKKTFMFLIGKGINRLRKPDRQEPKQVGSLDTRETPEVPCVPMAAKLKETGILFEYNETRAAAINQILFKSVPSPEDLKNIKEEERQVALMLHQYFRDKAIKPSAVDAFARNGLAGTLFINLVLRDIDRFTEERISRGLRENPSSLQEDKKRKGYTGTPEENAQIDEAIAMSPYKNFRRRIDARAGATRIFNLAILGEQSHNVFKYTDVIVIGAGPAGEMMTRAMLSLGFNPKRIIVIDKTGEYGGIWNQKNVAGGSINSPFEFNFEGITLDPAPGSGSTAREFLRQIEDPEGIKFHSRMPQVLKGIVTSVNPGDLSHTVTVKTSEKERKLSAPIVINAIGNGKPLPPSREGHMTTDTPEKQGIRWQQVLTPEKAEKYRGKMLIFIGLGNSTAEMLIQLKKYNDQGYNIDYRVITHYSHDAVTNPNSELIINGKTQRVYRDLTKPNLTKYEGDLVAAREAYESALQNGKIISDITHWHAKDKKITVTTKAGRKFTLDYEQLFTLIGYGHDPEQMKQMGMKVVDPYKGTVATDYDGEVQRAEPLKGFKTRRGDIYPGYFVIGAVAKTDKNPNAIVMPGIMHRMYDMLHTAAYRAQEYQERDFNESRSLSSTRSI